MINTGFFLLTANKDRSLESLERAELLDWLAHYGAVLLRGFETDLGKFSALVERVTPETAIDPARAFFAKNVQLVDSGTNEIGLHCENGTTPLVPNVVWFFCERAATSGSQTTLCDGTQVWKILSAEAKALLLGKPIRFSRNVKHDLWVKYVKHHFTHLAGPDPITQKMLDNVFGSIPGAVARINDDGSLFLSQAVFAAHPTFWNNDIAFANSIFTPSHNYEAPQITFENGEEIPGWLLEECGAKANHLTTEVPWDSGDIILIDNTRVMHGRRRITDTNRKLFTALGFLSESARGNTTKVAREVAL